MAVADGGRAAARGDRLVKLIRSRGAVTCHRSFTYVLPNSQAAAPSLEERVRGVSECGQTKAILSWLS